MFIELYVISAGLGIRAREGGARGAEFTRVEEIVIKHAPRNISQFLEESRVTESTGMAPVSVKRVLISESVDPCCKTILQENGIEVTEKQQMTKEELIAEIQVTKR